MFRHKIVVILLNFLSLCAMASDSPEVPFWKAKAKLYERIQAGEIILAAHREGDNIDTNGGGQVKSSCAFVFARAQRYEELPQATGGYVTESHFIAAKNQVKMQVKALGYSARLTVQVMPREQESPELDFLVVEGPLKGFSGSLRMAPIKPDLCEVAFSGRANLNSTKIPGIFVKFGLEAGLKHMALKLKSYVEKQFAHGQAATSMEESAPLWPNILAINAL